MSFSSSNSLAANQRPGALRLPTVSVLAALAAFAGLQVWAYAIAHVFEYPLDDVYIHLRMAQLIGGGTYGINPGEPASAASSVLYPFLLVPFPGSAFQRLLPLAWNTLALAACAWGWGRVLVLSGIEGRIGWLLAILGPIGLNMPGVAFTGMENEIHAALTLFVVLGLWRYLTTGEIAPWFVAVAILSPLFRYEGLALSLGAAGAIALSGRVRAGVLLGLGVLLPILAFTGFLVSQGLAPLPSSVLTKMAIFGHDTGPLARMVARFQFNLHGFAAWILLSLTVLLVVLVLARGRSNQKALLPLVLALSGLGHLMFSYLGWMHRYEHYIFVAETAGALLFLGRGGLNDRRAAGLLGTVAVLASALAFLPPLTRAYVHAPRAIHLQQDQFARFARDYLDAPVAVIDIGRVSWNARHYVLDLWGLASQDARRIRIGGAEPPPGWAGPLAVEHGVVAAMYVHSWLKSAAPADWVPVARMTLVGKVGAIGSYDVTFYATGPQHVAKVVAALKRFAPTVPADAGLKLLGPAAK
ncbi:hypothetical protein [Solirhodobacter olei]|uniref:hypothetical protein n=1 Tax=Solirhodobacter olei TaxID=2493082 RepID=UPI000FD8DFFD|nr:hypothetical protein [Solirhodobacter olei]